MLTHMIPLSRIISKNENSSKESLKLAGLPAVALEELEPYDGKLSRTVLRGAGHSNVACLLDIIHKQKIVSKPSKTVLRLVTWRYL